VVSITPRPRFTPGERAPGTHCTGGRVGPRAGLDAEVRGKNPLPLSGIEPRPSSPQSNTAPTELPQLPIASGGCYKSETQMSVSIKDGASVDQLNKYQLLEKKTVPRSWQVY
jgi:hypothetical protein